MKPRGSGWRGRWEGGSGWGTHVNPWLFHFNVWQNPLQIKKNKNKNKINKALIWDCLWELPVEQILKTYVVNLYSCCVCVNNQAKLNENRLILQYINLLGLSLIELFSLQVVSNFLWPHELQHTRLPYASPSPWVCSNSCLLNQCCHPIISSSVTLFSCLQSVPASGSFPMSRLFASGGQVLELQL